MPTPAALVPASQVVATAKSLIEDADNIDRAFFLEWVYLGLQELGPNTSWLGEAQIYPTDYSLRKPDDLHTSLKLALYDSNGGELQYTYRGLGTRSHASDNTLVNDGTYAPALGSTIDLSEDQFYFHLGSSEGAQRVAYAKLTYFKLPTDANGDLLVPESDVLALTFFIRYMWAFRKNDLSAVSLLHPIWIRRRNEARTAHKIPDQLIGTEIARLFSSLIPKMRFKQF